jgi:deoxycytidylate deaminase
MYLSCGLPCADCARGIINSGVKRIFCERVDVTKGEMWKESQERSWDMFIECGVTICFYDDHII